MATSYYTLVAALPALPRLDRAEGLPISRERLGERLRMLEPDDADLLDRALAFFDWGRHPVDRTDAAMARLYARVAEKAHRPVIAGICGFLADQRTAMAALRRRGRGLPAPPPDEAWGAGPLARHVRRYWDDPDFGLAPAHPWISDAREYLAGGDPLGLERLLLETAWDKMDRLSQGNAFQFEAVFAYRLKWDILHQWLSRDAGSAQARFEELVGEAMNGNRPVLDSIPETPRYDLRRRRKSSGRAGEPGDHRNG